MWDRLRGKRVHFSGKFDWGVKERLTLLAREHGATIAKDIGPKVDYIIVRSLSGAKTANQRVKSLNGKGAAIKIEEADDFDEQLKPSDEEIIAVIRRGARGVELFNDGINPERWRQSGPAQWVITRESFARLDLTRFRLEQGDFVSCDFSRTKLERAEIASATDCKFDEASGNRFGIRHAERCSFKNARLHDGDFRDRMEDVDFSGADLERSEFAKDVYWDKKSRMIGLVFAKAKLQKVTFENVKLVQPDFTGADLGEAEFADATVESGNFIKANLGKARLAGSKLRDANFTGANLRNATFVDADLTGATFDGADLTGCNLRGAITKGVTFAKARGYAPASQTIAKAGPALNDLDKAIAKAKRIKFSLRMEKPIDGDDQITGDSSNLEYGWGVHSPADMPRYYVRSGKTTMSLELLLAARAMGDARLRFETLEIKTTKSKLNAKELREVMIKALCEAFTQDEPDSGKLAGQIKSERQKVLKATAGARKKRANALARAKAQQEKNAQKRLAKMEQKVAKAIGGKVSDITSFLKALEVRAEKAKIDKATKMLQAEKFQLFNDITDQHLAGVVKSQTDPDLVYACRVESNGHYACCTQNLNICGGLRGSICKHLLVLIIGLVKAGQLDPATIDTWVAKTRSIKPELDKEVMGEIFIRYKGAEAGQVDWRPTETVPEDYYAL